MPQFLGKAITGFGGGFDKVFVLEEGEGFEGVVSSLHPPEKDLDRLFENERQQQYNENTGYVQAEKEMEFGDENYQDEEHMESEEANQEEINYMNQMQQNLDEADMEEYDEDNEEYHQDHNLQEYQNYQHAEQDGDTKLYRTRGSGRSQTGNNERARTPGSKYEMGNTRTIQDSMGHLKQIVASKNHILQLTRDGFVFSYGTGEFSVSGHGGSKVCPKPEILKHLSDKRVVQIS